MPSKAQTFYGGIAWNLAIASDMAQEHGTTSLEISRDRHQPTSDDTMTREELIAHQQTQLDLECAERLAAYYRDLYWSERTKRLQAEEQLALFNETLGRCGRPEQPAPFD